MRSDTECQMLTCVAVDVENVSVRRELTMIAACGADQHDHDTALGHRLAVVVDIASDITRHMRSRRLVPQQLLDRLRYQARVLDELTALIGMLSKYLARPADQPRGCLITRA